MEEIKEEFKKQILESFCNDSFKNEYTYILIKEPFNKLNIPAIIPIISDSTNINTFKEVVEEAIDRFSSSFTIKYIIFIEVLEDCSRLSIEEYGSGLLENNLYYVKDNKIAYIEESKEDFMQIL